MKAFLLVLTTTALSFAQAPTIANATGSDSVIAIVEGHKWTVAEWERRLSEVPEASRAFFRANPTDLLRRLGFYDGVIEVAKKANLDKQDPYKHQIDEILFEAGERNIDNGMLVLPDEQKKYYEDHKDEFKSVRAKSLSMLLANPGAKEKLAELAVKARTGQSFADLQKTDVVRIHYEEAVPINMNPAIPDTRSAIIEKAKVGDITDPIRVNATFVIYQIDAIASADYDMVKDEIYKKLKYERFTKWAQEQTKNVKVEITNPDYFKKSAHP
jgi:hypothetical protein